MKFPALAAATLIAAAALGQPAQAQGTFKPYQGTFGVVPPAKPRTVSPVPPPNSSLWAPPAPRRAQPDMGPTRFKPYGVYPPGGGTPSAPKPPGYVDYYGTNPSKHPFAY